MTSTLVLVGLGLLVSAGSFIAGWRAASRYRVGKRQPDGFAGSEDFSWRGRPMRIVDAEVIARHAEGA